jgi:hypothetical protein
VLKCSAPCIVACKHPAPPALQHPTHRHEISHQLVNTGWRVSVGQQLYCKSHTTGCCKLSNNTGVTPVSMTCSSQSVWDLQYSCYAWYHTPAAMQHDALRMLVHLHSTLRVPEATIQSGPHCVVCSAGQSDAAQRSLNSLTGMRCHPANHAGC